jgi:hypothetical protein
MLLGKALELDALAVHQLGGRPGPGVHALVRWLTFRVINRSVVLERAVIDLRLDEPPQVLGRIPGVPQHHREGQVVVEGMGQPLAPLIKLALAVGVLKAVIDQPAPIKLRIDLHAAHPPIPLRMALALPLSW